MDFKDTLKSAAENVKRTTRCPEHGEQPSYEIRVFNDNSGVTWSFCCDKFKNIVVKKFEDELTNEVGNTIEKSLSDIFKI